MRTWAVRPNHAGFMMLVFIAFACGEDHQMLIENCNWDAANWVMTTPGSKVTLSRPSADLVSNLICRTRFYINDLSHTLKMRVRFFDLSGSNDCGLYSEMITLQISETDASKNISWCGGMYAQELTLPVNAVNLIYNTGAFGEGAGFELEFSAVPEYSCYDDWRLEVTTQPKLLYSPNYPGHYKSLLKCTVQLHAKEDQYIHIQSLRVQIELSTYCQYDALVINDVRYCGEDPIDIVIPASTVDIKFLTDGSKAMDGFILKYEAVPTEILNCTTVARFKVTAKKKTSVVVLSNNVPVTGRGSRRNYWCRVVVDSESDDDVLDVVILSRLSDVDNFTLMVDGETDVSQSGKVTINSSGPHSYQDSGVNTLNYLHSPGRLVVLNVKMHTGKFMFQMQAVNKEFLPQHVLARYSLVWVNAELARSAISPRMFVMPAGSGETVEVGVFYTDQDHTSLDSEADRLPVASYAAVYNGEDTSYFELTRGCGSNTSSQARLVNSIRSQNVTVVIKRNSTSHGFWMYFAPSDGSYVPQPEELSISKTFSTTNQVNVKNLVCKWTLSASSQQEMLRNGRYIRLRAANNFDPISLKQSFNVNQEKFVLMRYTKMTPRNFWMYSSKPISIDVSVFNNIANLQPLYFQFEYEILNIGADVQSLSCQRQMLQATETVQYTATPNYPAFFSNGPCEFEIVHNTQSDRRDNIFVDFPDMSNFPCSEGHQFQIITRNTDSTYFTWPKMCGLTSFHQSFQTDQVKIIFNSSSKNLLPGFTFMYYSEVLHTREVTLVAASEYQYLSSPNYPTNYPSLTDYQWHITTKSDSSVVDLVLVDFVLEEETQMICVKDYVEIYDGSMPEFMNQIKTMCGNVYYGQYSSTGSDLIIVFHSDVENNFQGFMFKYRSREKEFNVAACGQNITGIIIGVITGGLIFILLVVGVFIYLLKRRRRQRSNTHIRVPAAATGSQGPMSRSDNEVFIVCGVPINPSAPPSYWETQNSQTNSNPPVYSTVHTSGSCVLSQYADGYACEHPASNLLELPPPYSNLRLDASRLETSTSVEHTRNETESDLYDVINDSDDSPMGGNPPTSNAAQTMDNNKHISDPPPAYESGSYVQITGGHRNDPRRVPHIKNEQLGFL